MEENRTRLRVKLGAAEIEYEGGTEFLKDQIMPAVGKILAMVESRAELQRLPMTQIEKPSEEVKLEANAVSSYSTNTIANLLGAKTGGDLVIAAAAHLTLVKRKERLPRQEILDEMKAASSFFKSTYTSNLSKTLKVLAKADRLRLIAPEVYGLSQKEREALENRLAQHS